MYSRKDWGGNLDPFILTKFMETKDIPEGEDPIVSLVVFEWQDKHFIGKPVDPPDDVSDNAFLAREEWNQVTDKNRKQNSTYTSATKETSTQATAPKKTSAHSSQPTTRRNPQDPRSSPWQCTSKTPQRSTTPSSELATTALEPSAITSNSTKPWSNSVTPSASFPPLKS